MTKNDKKFIAQKIRTQYVEKDYTELDELKELDATVKRPARIFSYVFGGLGAIVMGSGMSLVMTDIGSSIGIGDGLVPGIVIGIVGLGMALVNYPIYQKMLDSRRRKYADEIVALSDRILEE